MYLDPLAGAHPLQESNARSGRRDVRHPESQESMFDALGPDRLPIDHLTPEEIAAQRLVALTSSELLLAVEEGRFYAERYDAAGRPTIIPTWQFVQPAPALIAPVIKALREEPLGEDPYFWMIAYEELSDLTPAEVLCGRLLRTRWSVSIWQMEYLRLSDAERQAVVMEALDLLPSRMMRAGC
jgi:hypothetical protein